MSKLIIRIAITNERMLPLITNVIFCIILLSFDWYGMGFGTVTATGVGILRFVLLSSTIFRSSTWDVG